MKRGEARGKTMRVRTRACPIMCARACCVWYVMPDLMTCPIWCALYPDRMVNTQSDVDPRVPMNLYHMFAQKSCSTF